ncbi:MAG: hypothetical protein ACOZIN_05115 [Myxococcota bacterium]
MDVRWLFAPLYAAVLCGAAVAVAVYARPGQDRPWFLTAGVGLLLTVVVSGALAGPVEWLSREVLWRCVGLVGLGGAGVLVVSARRARTGAELLMASAPISIDEAVRWAKEGACVRGVFRGRLGAEGEVVSPGGVVGAFFEAQVRALAPGGGKGPLLSVERAQAALIYLVGERHRAAVRLGEDGVHGTPSIRRCSASPRWTFALAEGETGVEALSFERVGKLGAWVLVAGRLVAGPSEGTYVLCGAPRGPASVFLSENALGEARRRGRGWWQRGLWAMACGLGGAFLLSQGL